MDEMKSAICAQSVASACSHASPVDCISKVQSAFSLSASRTNSAVELSWAGNMLNLQMVAEARLFQSCSRACHGSKLSSLGSASQGTPSPASLRTVSVCAAIPAAMPSILTSTTMLPVAPVLICMPVGTTMESATESMNSFAFSRVEELKGQRLGLGWQRMQAKHGPGDDSQRAKRAGHELGQVIASDVLHHFASAGGNRAVGQNHGDADDEVANAAVAQTQRAAVIGRDDAADGRAVGPKGSSASLCRCWQVSL